jgi:hypothetical protein
MAFARLDLSDIIQPPPQRTEKARVSTKVAVRSSGENNAQSGAELEAIKNPVLPPVHPSAWLAIPTMASRSRVLAVTDSSDTVTNLPMGALVCSLAHQKISGVELFATAAIRCAHLLRRS